MYDVALRRRALELLAEGRSANSVSKVLGVSRAAIRDWTRRLEPKRDPGCRVCTGDEPFVEDASAYAHLLGLYLGDGCISPLRKGVHSLRIACCDAYPRLMDECEASLRAVRPGGTVFRVRATGCTHVLGLWKHWPCVFPQHGPGRKHERAIVLLPWQEDIVREHPGRLLRGLFHSDGCRITNWTVRQVAGQPKRYEYPRYLFTNLSADIHELCGWALDLLEIPYTRPSPRQLSVARKDAVARLDDHVGPKS